jgi:hypothetical protein
MWKGGGRAEGSEKMKEEKENMQRNHDRRLDGQ